MGIVAGRNFGLLIAYVIPGFVALLGLSEISPALSQWLTGAGSNGPSAGGVVYLLLASLGAGLTASTFRWALIDTLHEHTGLRRPKWDDSVLWRRRQAYELLIEIHYNYYKFYANTAVALVVSAGALTYARGFSFFLWLLVAVTATVFVFASRNALQHYYRRASILLAERKKGRTRMLKMTNGGHHPKPGDDKKENKPKPSTNTPSERKSSTEANQPVLKT